VANYHGEEEDHCRRLGLVINLDDDDEAGSSSRPCGDAGQGCSSYLPQSKEEDYAAAMYRRLGLGLVGSDEVRERLYYYTKLTSVLHP
jgi:hypothetical protein